MPVPRTFETFLPSVRFIVLDSGEAKLVIDSSEAGIATYQDGSIHLLMTKPEFEAFLKAVQEGAGYAGVDLQCAH